MSFSINVVQIHKATIAFPVMESERESLSEKLLEFGESIADTHETVSESFVKFAKALASKKGKTGRKKRTVKPAKQEPSEEIVSDESLEDSPESF